MADAAAGVHADGGRRARVRFLIAAEPALAAGVASSMQRLCRALVRELVVMGAAVNLMSPAGSHGVAGGSDDRSERIDELQFTTGEGPCHEAFTTRRPVLVADLAADRRWLGYGPAATEAGVGAAFAFPLHVGAAGVGVLDVYAKQPGSLGREQLAMALTFAEIATETLMQTDLTTSDGQLDPSLETALEYRAEIYQAQGALTIDLGVSLAEALARMRGHAFAHDQDLVELARDIVAGRVDLDRDN